MKKEMGFKVSLFFLALLFLFGCSGLTPTHDSAQGKDLERGHASYLAYDYGDDDDNFD